ncbi:MFS transporter [Streptomyces sp. NPDC057617]|uniref:MFS transporter n=1 Tax=Streptomyces sp. NPDC057617 TaxID=3346184 RepID=UPI0036C99CC0
MQTGYGLGLFFLVPLGDLADRRRLIPAQLLLLAVALTLVGTATTGALLLVGMVAVGLLAVVTQTLVAFAASLAPAAQRGRVVGVVTSGVVMGILLARTVSGLLADLAGWRSVYLASAALTCVLALALHHVLPSRNSTAPTQRSRNSSTPPAPTPPDNPPTTLRYGHLPRSTVTLFVRERLLRLRALFALLIFAAFSTLWSCVALPLSAPPHSLSDASIGAFGLAGAAGALAAATAGRLNDRGLSRRTTGIGLALLTASWLIGGYMIFYSVGSASGAIASTSLYAAAGWGAVCALGAAISGLALLLWAGTRH